MLRVSLFFASIFFSFTASAHDFEAGQVWTYQTRQSEEDSRLTVLRVDEIDGKRIVSIQITGLKIIVNSVNKPVNGSVIETLGHAPIEYYALEASVTGLVGNQHPLPDYEEGYRMWRDAYDIGRAGYFTINVHDLVNYMEQTFNR